MAISDYNTNPNNNTTISGVSIAEGGPAANINNAIRQLMADLATRDPASLSVDDTITANWTISGNPAYTGSPDFSGIQNQTTVLSDIAGSALPTAWVPDQSTAETGTNNTLAMTPLRTSDAIAARVIPDVIIKGTSIGGFGTLELDTVVRNRDSIASLASNAVTLAAGTYYIRPRVGIRLRGALGSAEEASVILRDNTAPADLATVSSMAGTAFGTSAMFGSASVLVTFSVQTDIILHFSRGNGLFTTEAVHNTGHADPGDDHILEIWKVA